MGIGQRLSFESLLPEWSLIREAESEAAKTLVGGVADKEVSLRGQEISQDLFHGVPRVLGGLGWDTGVSRPLGPQ